MTTAGPGDADAATAAASEPPRPRPDARRARPPGPRPRRRSATPPTTLSLTDLRAVRARSSPTRRPGSRTGAGSSRPASTSCAATCPTHDPVADLDPRARRRPAARAPPGATSPCSPADDIPPLPDLAEVWARQVDRDDAEAVAPARARARRRRAGAVDVPPRRCTGASTWSPASSSPGTASSRCWRCRSCPTDPLHRHDALTRRRVRRPDRTPPADRPAVLHAGRGIGHTVPCRSPPRPAAAVQGGPTWTTCS